MLRMALLCVSRRQFDGNLLLAEVVLHSLTDRLYHLMAFCWRQFELTCYIPLFGAYLGEMVEICHTHDHLYCLDGIMIDGFAIVGF